MGALDMVECKDIIIEKYIPLVKHIASRVMIGKTKYIEYEDLVSYGIIGLIDAINKFDKSKGMKFSSYASIRIKGAMIDEIRKHRPISKGAMDKLARYNDAIEKLHNKLLKEPKTEEVAKYLGISVEEAKDIENSINFLSVVSLDSVIFSDDDEMTIMGIIEDKNSPSPQEAYEEKELVQVLSESIDKLNEKDKLILTLYYYENLTLKEIGHVLSVSESRVCQLHSRAIVNLRKKMKGIDYI